jgi:acetoin utilization protein AcuB
MLISDVMTTSPLTIERDASIRDALETLEREGFRHLPVVWEGELVGIVSDRDLRAWRQALLDLRDGEGGEIAQAALAQPIERLMTVEVETVSPDTPLKDAIDLLVHLRLGALPVVDGGQVVGIVSVTDVLAAFRDRLGDQPSA